MAFKSAYIKNPLKNIKEKNLEKVNQFTRQRRNTLLGATIPLGAIGIMSSSEEDDDEDQDKWKYQMSILLAHKINI